jgi:hypothetical protein
MSVAWARILMPIAAKTQTENFDGNDYNGF